MNALFNSNYDKCIYIFYFESKIIKLSYYMIYEARDCLYLEENFAVCGHPPWIRHESYRYPGKRTAATAPVIEADDEEIAQSISVIFLFNVIAALIFPALGNILHLSNGGFGLFAGTAVNDTSSVTATAAAWDGIHGSNTLNVATIVKLTRTLAIIPITLALAIFRAEKKEKTLEESGSNFSLKQVFPIFVLFFILASVITTVFSLPVAVTDPLKTLSKFFIVMAMSAIGLNTLIVKLVKTGGKPIFMGFCCWVAIAVVSLGIQSIIGIL